MSSRVYSSQHPLARHKLTLLRDRATDTVSFRSLTAELAGILTYEATLDLPLRAVTVDTPLTQAAGELLAIRVGLVPILRAGLGMVEGALRILPHAEVRHLGLYRDEETLRPVEYYNKLMPPSTVPLCLILDPMLATGGSANIAVDVLKRWGVSHIKFVGLIAAPEGIAHLHSRHPDVDVHVAMVDERLTGADDHPFPPGYIWPGLGDAGDRQFGTAAHQSATNQNR